MRYDIVLHGLSRNPVATSSLIDATSLRCAALRLHNRVARCLSKNMASVGQVYGKCLTKHFDNGSAIGHIGFSIFNAFYNSYFSRIFNF